MVLVKGYTIKLTDYNGLIITTIQRKNKPTDEEIEELLIEHKDKAMYCEISENYRLHSNTLHSNER